MNARVTESKEGRPTKSNVDITLKESYFVREREREKEGNSTARLNEESRDRERESSFL